MKKRIDNIGLPKDQLLGRLPPKMDGEGRPKRIPFLHAPNPTCSYCAHSCLIKRCSDS